MSLLLDYRVCPACNHPASKPGHIELRKVGDRIMERPVKGLFNPHALEQVDCGHALHREASEPTPTVRGSRKCPGSAVNAPGPSQGESP